MSEHVPLTPKDLVDTLDGLQNVVTDLLSLLSAKGLVPKGEIAAMLDETAAGLTRLGRADAARMPRMIKQVVMSNP